MNESFDRLPWYRRWTWRKLLVRGLLLVCVTVLVVAGLAHWHLRSSLPVLDGDLVVDGLTAAVQIERDAAGVPTITSTDRSDAAFALGFLHAQERFFQMDILRRVSSGRLSELLGANLVKVDQRYRKHRFQEAANSVVEKMPDRHRTMFRAYTEGVNRGLHELDAAPFEYAILRAKPVEWTEQDCVHVIQTMLTDLQRMDGDLELGLGLLHENVPQEVFDFLMRKGSSWDAAIDGTTIDAPAIPDEDVWSLRDDESTKQAGVPKRVASRKLPVMQSLFSHLDPGLQPGSNNWAVHSALGKDGRAILASDMHLGLRVPAIWYRAVMNTPCLDGKTRRLVGVTLPGVPGLVEGSNGEVAWGMTNSYGDFGDIIELKSIPNEKGGASDSYLTPDGPKEIEHCTEQIVVGGGTESIEYEITEWGPVVAKRGERRFVHHWIGDDPDALDTLFFDMETVESTDEAMALCCRAGILQLNVVVADRKGSIGWTLCGRLAKRKGKPTRTIQDWSKEEQWNGYLSPEEYPRIVDPKEGRVWTANNRVVGGAMMNLVGDSGMDQGGRVHQIRKRLFDEELFNEQDMLEIQLDDEALFLERWQKLLLETIQKNPGSVSEDFARHVQDWKNRASVDSVGYRIVRSFRSNTIEYFFGLNVARPDTASRWGAIVEKAGIERSLPLSKESVVWDLISQKPQHWLPLRFETWDELLVEAASTTEGLIAQNGPIGEVTWGARNVASIRHPLSASIPLLSNLLDMPSVSLPGDGDMPRVQASSFGASQRMVVSPGFEEQGIYHQPGGQSGHPYSPYYRIGYDDWCEGKPSPLLPGPTKYTLRLKAR